MHTVPREQRQLLGCGFVPPPANPRLLPMVRPWAGLGYRGDQPTTCPGYTTGLPEVVEIARARLHWSKGQLDVFVGGAGDVSEAMIAGIELLEDADNRRRNWAMTPTSEGGGMETKR